VDGFGHDDAFESGSVERCAGEDQVSGTVIRADAEALAAD